MEEKERTKDSKMKKLDCRRSKVADKTHEYRKL